MVSRDFFSKMYLFFMKRPPKNDESNLYVRLKYYYFPFWGHVVVTEDFNQEATFGKMSNEEFMNMVKTISTDCKHFSELKFAYFFMALFLIILHFVFPKFIVSNNEDSSEPNAKHLVPMVLFLIVYTLFALLIIRNTQLVFQKIQKVLRAENCMKYINRGLCWKLDINKGLLHLNLNYQSNSNQYLISEVMSTQIGMEEYIPYFDVENGEFQSLDSETQNSGYINKTLLWLGAMGGVITFLEMMYSAYMNK